MRSEGTALQPAGDRFHDRREAGAWLARHLEDFAGKDALVLGIPRGGVVVAAQVARHLRAELDVIVARKLGAPGQSELAIGAVTANGGRFLNERLIHELGVSPAFLHEITLQEKEVARRRQERLRGSRPPPLITNRIVIIVDDGLATGATMRAAVRSIRPEQPAKLVVAVPVGARETCRALRSEVDELVCPFMPEPFHAVGLHYEDFQSTEDAEVQRLLSE
jgi:putative phosphoribosyl transferase